MTALLCPLCSQPRFDNLESLRISLINAATQNISCPICSEVLTGLDKLTIHLFGHTLNQNGDKRQCLELKMNKPQETTGTETQQPPPTNIAPTTSHSPDDEVPKNSIASTVNLDDLGFLTAWDNAPRTDVPDAPVAPDAPDAPCPSEDLRDPQHASTTWTDDTSPKDNTSGLSEYMSDLLNKKLPVLNFVFTMDDQNTQSQKAEDGPEEFRCPTCDFTFQNSIILSMHQELVHSQSKKSSASSVGPEAQGLLGDFALPRYTCHLCSKAFKMKGSLLVHYRVAHLGVGGADYAQGGQTQSPDEKNFCCSICSKSFKKEQHLTQHIKTHDGKQWRCETCSKHFTTKYFLKKHQRLHTGEMPYACQTCNKTFTFQQSYHKHLLYHSDQKPHQCLQCGRAFKELSTLHNHQRIHSGEKPFACETCGKCFRQRVSYIVHQRIHTGVLPYQCTACKKKFRYKVSQRSHKCSAQPPGVVVRQPGDLIQRILENRNDVLQRGEPS